MPCLETLAIARAELWQWEARFSAGGGIALQLGCSSGSSIRPRHSLWSRSSAGLTLRNSCSSATTDRRVGAGSRASDAIVGRPSVIILIIGSLSGSSGERSMTLTWTAGWRHRGGNTTSAHRTGSQSPDPAGPPRGTCRITVRPDGRPRSLGARSVLPDPPSWLSATISATEAA